MNSLSYFKISRFNRNNNLLFFLFSFNNNCHIQTLLSNNFSIFFGLNGMQIIDLLIFLLSDLRVYLLLIIFNLFLINIEHFLFLQLIMYLLIQLFFLNWYILLPQCLIWHIIDFFLHFFLLNLRYNRIIVLDLLFDR